MPPEDGETFVLLMCDVENVSERRRQSYRSPYYPNPDPPRKWSFHEALRKKPMTANHAPKQSHSTKPDEVERHRQAYPYNVPAAGCDDGKGCAIRYDDGNSSTPAPDETRFL